MRRYSGLLAGCTALLLADTAVAVDFATATYGAGTNPTAVTGGDMDGDGDVDLVTANFDSNDISVLLNNGDGTFATKVDYVVETNPGAVQLADMDGNGSLDIVVTNWGSDTFSVLLNDGKGAFVGGMSWGGPDMVYGVALADYDHSGSIDVALSGPNFYEVQVRMNTGTPMDFAGADHYGSVGLARGIVTVDLNGDTAPDLALADQAGNAVTLLFNTGDGTFGVVPDTATGSTPMAIAAGDLNRDGQMDLVTANLSGSLSVLINTGGGAFLAPVTYLLEGSSLPDGVAIADMDGDGLPDLVAAESGTGNMAVLLNKGDGTFGEPAFVAAGGGPNGVFAADLNGDGGTDLAIANGAAVAVFLNRSFVVPSAFEFTAVTGAALGASVESGAVVMDGAGPVTIVGGEYSINGAAYTTAAGRVVVGDELKVRVSASEHYSTTVTAVLSVTGISAEFRVTTAAQPGGDGDSGSGGDSGGGSGGVDSGGDGGGGSLGWGSLLGLALLRGLGRRRRPA